MAAVLRQPAACVRLLSSNLMTRNKKHGWLRRMVGFVVGCAVVAALVVAGTNLATVATTKDAIVDKLYRKYGLDEKEIEFIESHVKEMA